MFYAPQTSRTPARGSVPPQTDPMQNPDAALAASPLRLLDDDTFRTMCALLLPPMFIPSASFQGARPGYTFKLSHGRLGYHLDHVSSSLVAVALGRLSLTCRALLARTAPHALTMRLRKSMVDLALPVSSADKAPSVADIANAEAALHALRDAGAQYPEDVEEATKQLAAAREWRRKACDLLGQRLGAALDRLSALLTLTNADETRAYLNTGVASNRGLPDTLVTWFTSEPVLDELNRLKGSPSEWERYVVLHAPQGTQELVPIGLSSLATMVLGMFKELPPLAVLMEELPLLQELMADPGAYIPGLVFGTDSGVYATNPYI